MRYSALVALAAPFLVAAAPAAVKRSSTTVIPLGPPVVVSTSANPGFDVIPAPGSVVSGSQPNVIAAPGAPNASAGVPPSAGAVPSATGVASPNDLLVLKFANVLEQLETEFYTQAIAKFQESDFTTAGFSDVNIALQQFQNILSDESTHTTVLASTLQSFGSQAITGCQFDFTSVLGDVTTMANVARLVEMVGVGAYIGAAPLITDPNILVAAATIVTVEARHQSILNILNAGTAIPQAFDIALTPPEVLALAGAFISGCDVGIQSLPALTVTNTGAILPGTALTFSFDALAGVDPNSLSCQMLAGGMPFSLTLPFSQCVVPDNLTGPVAIYVTNDTQPINSSARDRNLGSVLAGPTMAFIDNKPEALGSLARASGGAAAVIAAPGSASTQTLSPAQASGVVAGAQATPAAAQSAVGATSPGLSPDGRLTVNGVTMVPA